MYFILDCNGKVQGNPKGYRTFAGASRQESGRGSKTRGLIWQLFNEKRKANPECSRLISRITFIEA